MGNFFSVFGRLVPVILSLLVLGAHFMRLDLYVMTGICLLLTGLLLVRRPWSVRVIQAVLVLGGIEWILAMLRYVEQRKEIGDDWTRLAIILTGVALFTILSALVFFSKRLKFHYRIK